MVRLFVRHTVADYATWRAGYDAFEPHRRPAGVTAHAVYQTLDNPNDITVTHDFETAQQAQAFMGLEELKSAMQKAGVQGPPTIWLTGAK